MASASVLFNAVFLHTSITFFSKEKNRDENTFFRWKQRISHAGRGVKRMKK